MNSMAISIPDQNRQFWLAEIARCKDLRKLELSGQALSTAGTGREIADLDLQAVAVRNLIAPEVTRNLGGLSRAMRNQVIRWLSLQLNMVRESGSELVVFDLGVGRNAGDNSNTQFVMRVKLLRDLMAVAASQDITFCLQARFPRVYPRAPQWDLVGNIIHEVMHPNCRLALDLFPAELEEKFDIGGFLRQCAYNLGVLRINFEPLAGDTLSRNFLLSWREALQKYLFKGCLIFRPLGYLPIDSISGIVQKVEGWSLLMG